MQVISNYEQLVWLLSEVLLPRWRSTPKGYPFNRRDSVIPQTIVPDWLRSDMFIFPNWYMGVDEHMKGRIESIEAFRGHIRLAEKHPWFYIPRYALRMGRTRIIDALEECIPSDSENVARDWLINIDRLEKYYDGDAINLLKGVDTWDEAVRRIKNKRTKAELGAAGHAGEGFYGHQEKMVSMQVYFQHWEGWLKEEFPYPAPSDIQNLRDGKGAGILKVPDGGGLVTRDREAFMAPWRDLVLRYVIEFKEDPKEVADVLWLFGKLMCGSSPLTETSKKEAVSSSGMFDVDELPHIGGVKKFLQPKFRARLEATCLVCPLLKTCEVAIPARPYYDKGQIELRVRPRVEEHLERDYLKNLKEPEYFAEEEHPEFAIEHSE